MIYIDLLFAHDTNAMLVNPWKLALMVLPFFGWAWLVATKLDKDAKYFYLNQRLWNGIHLGAGLGALAAMLFIPIFWVGWPVGILVLLAPILIYWRVRNQEVPEDQRYILGSGEGLAQKMEQRRLAKAARSSILKFTDSRKNERRVPKKEDPAYLTYMAMEDVIAPALISRATRIELAVGPNGCTVSQVIDGVRYKRDPLEREAAIRVIDLIKDFAGLDVEDRRRKQTGSCMLTAPDGSREVTVTTAGSSTGQVLRIEFDRAKRLNRPFDALGLLPTQLEQLRSTEQSGERHGIMLIGAPPGHGLSTSLYSFLARHDAYTSNIKSLERELETHIDGVDQVEWDPTNPAVDYATNLQAILRRDPDVVMTSEVRDRQTAEIVCEPGIKGPLIYVPQSDPTVPEQIRAWVKLVGDVKLATRPLIAVTNQRLLRTVCTNCRQPYAPTPEQLKKMNLPAGKVGQLYRASGKVQIKNKIEDCPVCQGLGYLGQTAAFEVMRVNDEIRSILQSGDLKAAMAAARRNKMIYLQEAALSKVISGETTIEEVIRVTAPAAKSEKSPTAAA